MKKPVTTIINDALRAAGLEQRLVRGRGYYYVTNCGLASVTALYTFKLERTLEDLNYALAHVAEVLKAEGVDFDIKLAVNKALFVACVRGKA